MHFLRRSRTKLLCLKIVYCTFFHIFPQNQIFINFLFQLWEEAQLENIHLRDDLNKVRDELKSTKKKLDNAIAVRFHQSILKKGFFEIAFFVCFLILGKVLVHLIVLKSRSPKKIWGKLRQCWRILKLFKTGYEISMNLIPTKNLRNAISFVVLLHFKVEFVHFQTEVM